MITAGIDAGSRAIKVVLFDPGKNAVAGAGTADQGTDQEGKARRLFEEVLDKHGIGPGEVCRIVATGYGRHRVTFAQARITEITCHARGVNRLLPGTRTIVEIGGQDSKVIRLGPEGAVRDFNMNDRCAAGTGRFLEVVAERLEVRLEDLGVLAARSESPAAISSMCVVFAETEIIGLLAAGVTVESIVAGVQASVASRVASLAGRNREEPVVFTGGVARIPGMKEALSSALGVTVTVPPDPQLTGALGAAIMASGDA